MSTIHKAAGTSGRAVYRTAERRQLLALLAKPRTQAEIVGLTGRKRPALSRALNRMKALGLVKPAGFGEACHNTAPLLWVACGELS